MIHRHITKSYYPTPKDKERKQIKQKKSLIIFLEVKTSIFRVGLKVLIVAAFL